MLIRRTALLILSISLLLSLAIFVLIKNTSASHIPVNHICLGASACNQNNVLFLDSTIASCGGPCNTCQMSQADLHDVPIQFSCVGATVSPDDYFSRKITLTAPSASCTAAIGGKSKTVTVSCSAPVPPPPGPPPGPPPLPSPPPTGPPATPGPTPSSLSGQNPLSGVNVTYCAVRPVADGPYYCVCGTEQDVQCNQNKWCANGGGAGGTCTRIPAHLCGATPLTTTTPQATPKIEDLGQLIGQLFTWSLSILGLSLFVMILYAGFEWLTAAGNPGQIGKAKGRIRNAVLGAILLLSSYIILQLISPAFVQQGSQLPVLGTPPAPRPSPPSPLPTCINE